MKQIILPRLLKIFFDHKVKTKTMKKTELNCQNPKCRRKYFALRNDSRFCCPACRTAEYRIRLKEKEKFQSLCVYNPRHSEKVGDIKRALASQLKLLLQYEMLGSVSLVSVKTLKSNIDLIISAWGKLKTYAISDQIEWIWLYIPPFLEGVITKFEKENRAICYFRLTNELRNGIEKSVKI